MDTNADGWQGVWFAENIHFSSWQKMRDVMKSEIVRAVRAGILTGGGEPWRWRFLFVMPVWI
ncbi:MAG: hypothetical protein HQM03_12700 [Magnetococcales bacterium]|nr:hypothetical protein [Magnetococcales bacterium]